MTENSIQMLKRTGKPALRFSGALIGEVNSIVENSGLVDRGEKLALYVTASGKLVVHVVDDTWDDDRYDSYTATVCTNDVEIYECLGYGWLAQELYAYVGLEPYELID